jgi:RimJ/RimL family protein N-acetyltransferase
MLDIPVLESERLRLRGWDASDADALRRIYADPITMRYIGDGSTMPPDRAWRAIAFELGHWALRGYGQWAVTDRASGEVLGRAGLYNPEGWPGTEVGWLIDRPHWGQGLATEAAELAVAWAWETLDEDQLIHLIRPNNHASIRVAEKLGARFSHRMDIDGGPVVVYTQTRPSGRSPTTEVPGPRAADGQRGEEGRRRQQHPDRDGGDAVACLDTEVGLEGHRLDDPDRADDDEQRAEDPQPSFVDLAGRRDEQDGAEQHQHPREHG